MGLVDFFRRRAIRAAHQELMGVWTLVRAAPGIDAGDGCQVELAPDGNMTYIIREGDRLQIMKLVFRVEGDELVTNQPSTPREERTQFRIEGNELVLRYASDESRFRRDAERWFA
jgi:hypothetical protein